MPWETLPKCSWECHSTKSPPCWAPPSREWCICTTAQLQARSQQMWEEGRWGCTEGNATAACKEMFFACGSGWVNQAWKRESTRSVNVHQQETQWHHERMHGLQWETNARLADKRRCFESNSWTRQFILHISNRCKWKKRCNDGRHAKHLHPNR